MASFKWDHKDPSDVSDYLFDWGSTNLDATKRFLAAGVTISTYTFPNFPVGITKASDALTLSSKAVTFRVSGGTAGTGYDITNRIVTSDGQTFEITKTLRVEERISPTA